MTAKYPVQSRLLTQEEKEKAEGLAARNGVSLSALIRLLLMEADREGWTLRMQLPTRKAAA